MCQKMKRLLSDILNSLNYIKQSNSDQDKKEWNITSAVWYDRVVQNSTTTFMSTACVFLCHFQGDFL
jgi:hypothetical protein